MPVPPTDAPEVVVAGHLCLDVMPVFGPGAASLDALLVPGSLVEVGPPVLSTGGAVSNTGLALHRLGVRTRLLGKVGDDLFGRAILEVLSRYGPGLTDQVVVAPSAASSYTLVVNPPGIDRVFLHCPGPNDTFHPDEITPERVGRPRLFHFGYPPLMRQTYLDRGKALAALFERLRARDTLVSLDMAQPDPAADGGRVDWAAWLERVLPHVDVFVPSLDEILFMLGEKPAAGTSPAVDGLLLDDVAARLLGLGAGLVALKLGDRGLYLRTGALSSDTLEPWHASGWQNRALLAPCFEVEVAGTTGAGDTTVAGLLAAFLRGYPPEPALRFAAGVGAFSVEQADATSGIPPAEAVAARIAAGWPHCPVSVTGDGWRWDEATRLWHGPLDGEDEWMNG